MLSDEQKSKIFESRLMLLKDKEFLGKIKSQISHEFLNVEQAVEIEISRIENQLR